MSVYPSKKREYPGHADYDLAVQNIGKFVFDPVLKVGKPRSRQGSGVPLSYPGGFAKAYVVDCGVKTYALRVWLHDIGDAAHHYHAVADFFVKAKGKAEMEWFVEDFHFVPDGILVNGQRFPILRMEWVSGSTAGDFIGKNIGNRGLLKVAAGAFLEMVKALHRAQMAHGDLQAENMIVSVAGQTVRFKLIDYDTLVVPALVGRPISSTGLECYQHPRRRTSQNSTAHDDYFSELVIYVCLLALSVEPELWKEFPKVREKELLFAPEDFSATEPTALFRRLYAQGGMVKWLAVVLWNSTRYPAISQLQPLEKAIELATEALGSRPGVAKEEEKGAAPARNRFDEFLKQRMGMGQGAVGALPKSWVDEEAFLRPPAPVASPVPGNRRASGGTAGTPGTAGVSFTAKLQGMQPARPAAAPSPTPAAARAAKAPVTKPSPKPWKPLVFAIVIFMLGIIISKISHSGSNPPEPKLEFPYAPKPPVMDEKTALANFKTEIESTAKWIEEKQKTAGADPAAGIAMVGEIVSKFKSIKTDGLPADLKATWGEMTGVMAEFGDIFKGLPKPDPAKPDEAMKAFGEIMPKMMAVQGKIEPIAKKLEELGKKYGLDLSKVAPGGGK